MLKYNKKKKSSLFPHQKKLKFKLLEKKKTKSKKWKAVTKCMLGIICFH